MPLAINPSAVPGYLLSDSGQVFSCTGTSATSGYSTYWEANYEDFLPVIGDTLTLANYPRTYEGKFTALRVKQMSHPLESSWTIDLKVLRSSANLGSVTQNQANASPWDSLAMTTLSALSKALSDIFIESRASSSSMEAFTGFYISSAEEINPSTLPYSLSNNYGFYLREDGKYFIIVAGQVVNTLPLSYKKDYRFRTERAGDYLYYKVNGKTVERVSVYGLTQKFYPAISFNKNGSGFYANMVYAPTVGSLTDYKAETSTIKIYGVCPGQPNYSYKILKDNVTLASTAEDGSMIMRKKSRSRISFSLQYEQRPFDEFKEILDFWNHHERHIPFIYKDISNYDSDNHTEYLVRFDTALDYTIEGPNNVTWSLSCREV